MALEKLDTQVRREQIVAAALNLIAAQGLRRLSVGAVARRVGLVPSAIYRHFKNKEEMLGAAFQFVRRKAEENLNAVCEQAPGALERLEGLLKLNIRMVRELQALPRIIFAESVYADRPERKRLAYEMVKGYLGRLEEIVRQGQQQGQIRSDVDPHAVAVMFWGLLPPSVILWHISDGNFDVTKHAERAWQLFSEALRAR
jgi:AcrR family transcriptional regulator